MLNCQRGDSTLKNKFKFIMQVYNHSLYQFNWDAENSTLQFNWTDENQHMKYEDFQEACANYAGFAHEYQSDHLLIDARNFVFELPPEYTDWLENFHYPRLNKAGLKKMAHIILEEWLPYVQDSPASEGRFALQYFTNLEQAKEWLAS